MGPSFGAAPAPELAPIRLRIGIVPFNAPNSGKVALDDGLRRYFAEVRNQFRKVGLDVEVVPIIGNYYQVLDWLEDGLVDGVVVSSFSAHLLLSDRTMAVVPLIEFSRLPVPRALNAAAPATVAAKMGNTPYSEPMAVFTRCLERVLESVRKPPLVQQCEFRFVSHLSSTGFVAPLMASREFADAHNLTPQEREEFWPRVLEWSRFVFWHDAQVPRSGRMPTIEFSYSVNDPRSKPLETKATIANVNDVLILGRRRPTEADLATGAEFQRSAFLEHVPSATRPSFETLLMSPTADDNAWVLAGLAAFPVEGDNPRVADEGATVPSRYRSSAAWCAACRADFTKTIVSLFDTDPVLAKLFDEWYRQGGYDFSIDELIDLLQTDQLIRGAPKAALVLPGGGVRATYQSVILDSLYSRRIANVGKSGAGSGIRQRETDAIPADRLVIDGIAGTSGGALLGYLASRRDHNESRVLTAPWIDTNRNVKTTPLAVFPAWGVMRWLSFVVLLTIFAATSAIHLPSLRVAPSTQVPFWYTSMLSLVLIAAPFLIWRNVAHDPEYSPRWELGAFLVVLAVAHFIHSVSLPYTGKERNDGWLLLGVVIILLGGFIIYSMLEGNPAPEDVAAAPGAPTKEVVPRDPTIPGNPLTFSGVWTLCSSSALLLIVAGLTVATAARGARVDTVLRRAYLEAGLVLLILVVGSALVFWVGLENGHVTVLELTLDYWVWLFVGALFASKLIVTTGRLYPGAPLRRGIEFLSSPSGTAPFPYTPTVSMIIWSATAIAIWLIFLAPSLYSGGTGRATFAAAAKSVGDEDRAPLIVSMTAFGSEVRGYRSYPRGDYYACSSDFAQVGAPDGTMSARLFRIAPEEFPDAVFASASPFPIYPAAGVNAEKQHPGLFLDGGYAHRVPIEGASLLQAAQILVVENKARKERRKPEGLPLGTLTTNLANAVGFLFQRSQVIDSEKTKHALVGTISPDWSGPDPFLMDFRESVVRRLHDEAVEDLRGHRVAWVQSWGVPTGYQSAGDQ